MKESYTLPLIFREIPVQLRMKWALEAVFAYLAQQQKVMESEEFLAILSEILVYWQIPDEYAEELVKLTKQPTCNDLDLLTTYAKLLVPSIEFETEIQPKSISKTFLTSLPKERLFRIWTEEGNKRITEPEYKKNYANAPNPHSKEPLVWGNMETNTFSLWVGKECRRREAKNITGQKQTLFCMFLRKFNTCIPAKELEEKVGNHCQVLNQLYNRTFGVLRPFIETHTRESRILKPHSRYNHKKRFSFCLIEPL